MNRIMKRLSFGYPDLFPVGIKWLEIPEVKPFKRMRVSISHRVPSLDLVFRVG